MISDMTAILVTGMSGTGKTTALAELARRGHRTVDTDYGGYSVTAPDGQLWIADRITALLDTHPPAETLFLAGCVANQGAFYPRFNAVVLLSAPLDILLARVTTRATNPYGRTPSQQAEIATNLSTVEPLLRRGATTELDARRPPAELADQLEAIAVHVA
jgi:shikimate kinase